MRRTVGKDIRRGTLKLIAGITASFLLAPLFFSSSVLALPSPPADHDTVTENILFEHDGYSAVLYDNSNGLPTSEANDIVQTSDGFTWIGSYSGLIRYDGNTFERIDSTTGIASVVCLFVDSRDRLWVGTNDSGLAVMEQDGFRMFGKAEGLNSESIRCITEDSSGNIIAATTAGIAVIDGDMNLTMVSDVLLGDSYVREVSCGADGTIYGVTVDGDLFMLKDNVRTGYYGTGALSGEVLRTVTADPEIPGRFYLGTKESSILVCDTGNTVTVTDTINTDQLACINKLVFEDDKIWVCADNGIGIVYDGLINVLNNIPLESSVEEMMIDYQGNLWFTSARQGVMKIVHNRFSDIFERYDIPEVAVNATCIYNDNLCIGKDNGLTVLGDYGPVTSFPVSSARTASREDISGEITDLISTYSGVKIRSMMCDSQGRLWICSFSDNALIRYSDGEVTRFNSSDGLPSNRVRMICERSDGTFAVACTGGVAIISGDSVVRKYDVYSGIGESDVLTISETSDGKLLLGTDGGGIYVVSDDGIVNLTTENGLSSDVIMRIKPDRTRGIYWIVTSNSIAYMDEDLNITTIGQFPYSNNFDLYENNSGDMWILSSNGIYVVSVDELIANGEIDPIYYGRDNGLQSTATANSYSALTDEGDLYIAGSSGVIRVNIDTMGEQTDDIKTSMPYIEADGIRIYPDADGTFNVPSSAKKITLYCYVFTYALSNPDVVYFLDGFDQTPVEVSRDQFGMVDYTNLKGGTYHFTVRLCDSHGNMGEPLVFTIVKDRSLIEQWWFITALALLALLLVIVVVKTYIDYRMAKYKEKEEHDRMFIREMTEAVANTIDMKDKYTKGHSTRVAEYTVMLAKELGLPKDKVDMYYNIALLHDIGKIGIPPEVLNKPGKLTDTEFMMIKSHAKLGYNSLKHITTLPELAIGAKSHHERPDGKGYPDGLVGDQIPEVARVIAVADTFDAMYSDRPYRKRMNFDKVVSIMKEVRGTQLDSDVVDAFLRLVDKGEFRAPDDDGGGSVEDINNIHKKFDKEAAKEEQKEAQKEETSEEKKEKE